ncbi:MAG TPA: N-acetylmuramoyl-L-alanine amidase [Thermoanaerobaculia bacterium]|nr:N-acetylmuramoyl-L-alanine amidase [Thermoanaerobaculia bacterium]
MKRFLPLFVLAAATILLAQSPNQATLRAPNGDHPVTMTQAGGQTLFAADEFMAALGGAVSPDGTGFKATLNDTMAAFGPDSRFAVVRDELIEMPVAPSVVDGRPYVPLEFFKGYLAKAADLETAWDPIARVLTVRPTQRTVIGVQLSVANVQGISKVVITLSGPADYTIIKEQTAYTIRFKTQIRAPFASQAYDDPYVGRATFTGSDLRLDLKTPDVGADAYKLENPFRIVLDFHKVAAGPNTTPAVVVPGKPVETPGIHTIVLDPGHGGKETGAIGPDGLMEKDATLNLCRKLADNIETKLKTRVILTRTDDSVVPLDQRTAIANQYKADLFLSVHMNAAVVKDAHGSETYFLSLEASDELAKKAAEVENATASTPPVSGGNDLKMILWDLAQQEYLNESSRFAQAIQEEMNRATGVQNRGVKQAPFKVLVGATMPAALVEVAFITNPEEEAKLKSAAFQDLVVNALTTAIERYKTDYETRIGAIRPPASAPAAPEKRAGTQ